MSEPVDSSPRADARGVWGAVACLVVGLALTHGPMFRGMVVGNRDMVRWVHPALWRVREAIAHGHLPRWNALEGLGFPALVDPLYAVFYPPMLLTQALPPIVAITVVWWLHLVLAAVGMFTLARRMERSLEAAALAGFAYALSGPLASEWILGMLMLGHCWLPWIAVGAWELLVRGDRSPAAVARAAIPVGLALLVGEPFVVMFCVIFATVLGLAAAPTSTRPWPALARWCAAVAAAALLAAPTLTPPLALVSTTQRAGALSAAELNQWSLHPLRLVDLVTRGGVGLAAQVNPTARTLRWVDGRPFLESLYVGALTAALAGFGLRRRRVELALLAVGVVALAASIGRHTPALAALRAVLFPLRFMRTPEKFVVLFTPSCALLAASGLDAVTGKSFILSPKDRELCPPTPCKFFPRTAGPPFSIYASFRRESHERRK